VRCFEDENVTHVEGSLDPVRDAEIIETELLLRDLESIDKRLPRVEKSARSGDKEAVAERDALLKMSSAMNDGTMARVVALTQVEADLIDHLNLLTRKPILYVANVDEEEIQNSDRGALPQRLADFATGEGNACIRLCGKLEQEIAVLDAQEKNSFLTEFGLSEPGLDKLIHATYDLLGYDTFFTGGPDEVRAWTVRKGATAPEAAGVIHTDFQRGFIKAEVFKFDDLVKLGSEQAVKEKGLARQEGKEYRVQDGDVMFFKFNV
ncbi:MAG: redox-regulated ATPase YchF, partial [Candidatus Marinimicrobia bacterium]|nr:redox-regulated ATPase YchF [Candidatus Neomarinimicrobiota bacterium]